MTEATYSVTGMTCDHCVRAVEAEVGKIAGVASVSVDLAGGQVTLRSDDPVDPAEVRAAVEEAGYVLERLTPPVSGGHPPSPGLERLTPPVSGGHPPSPGLERLTPVSGGHPPSPG